MEDNAKLIESLFNSAIDYGKTSFELAKLKILDKSADIVSSFIPNTIVLLLIVTFLIFANMGLAFWLGGILGETFLGFFAVAGFYAFLAIIVHFFLHKKLKLMIGEFIIKHAFNK